MCIDQQPASPQEAMGILEATLDYLGSVNARELAMRDQVQVLAALGRVTAKTSAIHAAALKAFDDAGGPEAEGCKNAVSWLANRKQVSKAAARQANKWSRTLGNHPLIADALGKADITESFAKLITGWTGKLPEHMREGSDAILITAATSGCGEHELSLIAAKLWEEHRSSRPDPDEDEPEEFADRNLHLQVTMDGAGRITGDLTPQCAAALQAVLDALGKHRGSEDTRTLAQRQHDALAEALSMLLAAGGLPQRHGNDTQAEVLIPITALRQMDGASVLEDAWLGNHTPGAPVFLSGQAAEAAACDATLIPVVTGHPDWMIVDQIIELAIQHTGGGRDELRLAIGKLALDFVSGPAGIASVLRTHLLGGLFSSPSLPLDIGYSETIPAPLRRAVINRDRHCQWPGGCDAPAARCDVHHIIPKSKGGRTSLANCTLLCKFHHLICIHAWGWVLSMQAGVMSVTSPDGKTSYTSRGPPALAGLSAPPASG